MPKTRMPPPNKKRKVGQVEEITFDYDARHDYLTGFHKRKQQRIKNRQDARSRKEREQKIEERKQIREQRRKDLEAHVQSVNDSLKKFDEQHGNNSEPEEDGKTKDDGGESEEDSFEGFGDPEVPETQYQDQEYIDEDLYTTVTVNPITLSGDEEEEDSEGSQAGGREINGQVRKQAKEGTAAKSNKSESKEEIVKKPKKKKRQFKYETKAERQFTKRKERSKGSAAKKLRTSIRK